MTGTAGTTKPNDLPEFAGHVARSITVLGSTGSVGRNTLDVIAHARKVYGDQAFPIAALSAQTRVGILAEQARALRPRLAVIGDPSLYGELKDALSGTGIEVAAGDEAVLSAAARPADLVMVAIVGAAGLMPALAAVERGATVALANKECIVSAGAIFKDAVAKSGSAVIPVDSEHNAAFQILDFGNADAIDRLTLTASGGPFRDWTLAQMSKATPDQAVAHPNWSMGAKISVDSATLMNKGLELIEAHYLFSLPVEKLSVVIHPQSIVHCLVSYSDGSTLAHLSAPDMRTPISHALAWPRRMKSPSNRLDLAKAGQLTFIAPDVGRFPALRSAMDCLRAGGSMPNILNAANEVAVGAFLEHRISFLDVHRVVDEVLEAGGTRWGTNGASELEEVLAVDRETRQLAAEVCQRMSAQAALA